MLKTFSRSTFRILTVLSLITCLSIQNTESSTYTPCPSPDVSEEIKISSIFGSTSVAEPVLIEIMKLPVFKRLKKIYQHGEGHCLGTGDDYNRYDHSINVFLTVRRHGGDLFEQIAALTHDISHTVFSHTGSYFFATDDKKADSYQDDTHEQYLIDYGVKDLLQTYGITIDQIHHKNNSFKRLEQPLPSICADRFEYNIQDGLQSGFISLEEAKAIINNLHYSNEIWFFTDRTLAKKFARIGLFASERQWGSPEGLLTNQYLGQALRRAAELTLITPDMVKTSHDKAIWAILESSTDTTIQHLLMSIRWGKRLLVVDNEQYDTILYGKFRGIDPFIKTDLGFQHLSEIDQEFNYEFERCKKIMAQGWKVKLYDKSLLNGIWDK